MHPKTSGIKYIQLFNITFNSLSTHLSPCRSPQNQTLSKNRSANLTSARAGGSSQQLWRHSTDPLRQPLLKSLTENEELAQEAIKIFINILKYMGDLPCRALRERWSQSQIKPKKKTNLILLGALTPNTKVRANLFQLKMLSLFLPNVQT